MKLLLALLLSASVFGADCLDLATFGARAQAQKNAKVPAKTFLPATELVFGKDSLMFDIATAVYKDKETHTPKERGMVVYVWCLRTFQKSEEPASLPQNKRSS